LVAVVGRCFVRCEQWSPERWGSLLVQEKYREEMPVTETSISYSSSSSSSSNNNNNNNNNKLYKTLYRKKHRGRWRRRRRRKQLLDRDYSGHWNTKQQIHLCRELVLEGTMERTVLTQTIKSMYINTVWLYRGHWRCWTDRVPQVANHFTIKLSGNYNDRGGRDEN